MMSNKIAPSTKPHSNAEQKRRERMKKTRVLLAAALLVGLATSAQATSIINSKHDLASGSTGATIKSTNQNQTCVFCHTPHNAQINKLLWNRINNPVAANMKIYTSYNTGAMRTALTQNALTSDSSSLLCLSCHSIATANITQVVTLSGTGNVAGTGTAQWSSRTGNMSDLTNDHPVGISYAAAQGVATATGLVAPTGSTVVNGARTLRLFKANGGTTQLECASCHSVHDSANGKFLAINNAGSNLCTTCHVK